MKIIFKNRISLFIIILFLSFVNIQLKSSNILKDFTCLTSDFNFVKFIDSNIVFCGGTNGALLKSTNQGIDWTQINTGTMNTLYDICYSNKKNIFIVGAKGTLLKSVDFGISWLPVNMTDSLDLLSIQFDGINSIYVSGTKGSVYKTANEGTDWNKLTLNINDDLNSILVIGKILICSSKSGNVIRSSDSGNTWSNLSVDSNLFIQYYNITKSDDGIIYILGNNHIYISLDSGLTWLQKVVPNNASKIICYDNNNIITLSNFTDIYLSTDGCDNFSKIGVSLFFYPTDNSKLNSIAKSGNMILAAGTGKLIFKSLDGGKSWNIISFLNSPYIQGSSIFFINKNVGFIGGSQHVWLYKTVNGGATWLPQPIDTAYKWTGGVKQIYFFDEKKGYIFNNSLYALMLTYDGGLTFNYNYIPSNIDNISILDSNFLFSTYNDFLQNIPYLNFRYTIDKGQNWQIIKLDSVHSYSSKIMNQNLIYACGYAYDTSLNFFQNNVGCFFKSKDKGLNWNRIKFDSLSKCNQLWFLNKKNGFIAGEFNYSYTSHKGFILKTTDSGETWVKVNSIDLDAVLSISFVNDSFGIAVGRKGIFMATTNQGKVWEKLEMPENLDFGWVYQKANIT